MKTPTILAAIALAIVSLLPAPEAHAQQSYALTLTNTVNGLGSVNVAPGGLFQVTLTLNATASSIAVDYFLQILNGGSNSFRLTGRDLSGSTFNTPFTSDAIALEPGRALLDPANDDNLGGRILDANSPNGAGTFLVANLTLQVLPGAAPGSYTLSTLNGSVGDGGFNDNPLGDATFNINVIPEPATTLLLVAGGILGGGAWLRRRAVREIKPVNGRLMKLRSVASILTLSVALISSANAQVLSNWTFENTSVAGASGSDFTYGPADSGLRAPGSSASGRHATAATTWSFPAGNGSPRAFSANNWSVGDYFQFSLSTVGFQNLTVSFDQTGSNTGPRDFNFAYSLNGVDFTNFGSLYSLTNDAWSAAGSPNPVSNRSFDLSIVPGLNDAPNVFFRIVDATTTSINGGTVATAGTGRIDNFVVTAAAIPEPSTYMLFGVGGLLCAQRFLRRKK